MLVQDSTETFFRKVRFWGGGGDAPPVFQVDSVSYLHVKVGTAGCCESSLACWTWLADRQMASQAYVWQCCTAAHFDTHGTATKTYCVTMCRHTGSGAAGCRGDARECIAERGAGAAAPHRRHHSRLLRRAERGGRPQKLCARVRAAR